MPGHKRCLSADDPRGDGGISSIGERVVKLKLVDQAGRNWSNRNLFLMRLPGSLRGGQLRVLILDGRKKRFLHLALSRTRELQERLGVPFFSIETLLGNVVEEGAKAIEIFLAQRIIFMVVASRAA